MNNLLKTSASSLLFLIIIGFSVISFSETSGVHTIFEVKGKVSIKKKQWKSFQPASVGLLLSSDDEVEVAANASVKVYCSNTKIWIVKSGKHKVSNGCPSGIAVLRLPNSNTDTLRADGMTEQALAKVPYVISPRETFILTNHPKIKWNAVSGATNYTVKIDGVNWETRTSNTEIIYSGEPLLQEGRRYRITIKADNGSSSLSDDTVGFKILDESTKKTVLEAVNTIKQQQLTLEEKGMILAHLYRGYELYADAVEVLEGLVNEGTQEVAIYQLLGDTYLKIGLPQLAKKSYEKAWKMATNTDNLALHAAIQASLGKIYGSLGDEGEAVRWLEKAKAGYRELGDSSQVQELDTEIDRILGRQ